MTTIESLASAGSLHQIGVPRAAACVLAACAGAADLCPDLPLRDALAGVAFERLGGDLGQFSQTELRSAARRAFQIDELARGFFERTPGGLGVGIWPTLGTRAHRLPNVPWVDFDAPRMADLRRFMLPPRRGWLQLGACACRPHWIDLVCGNPRRRALFVLDESVLPILGDALMRCLDNISRAAPRGSELIVAFDQHVPLRPCAPPRAGSALEVVIRGERGGELLARYPRLRFVASDGHERSVGAPALAHLRVI